MKSYGHQIKLRVPTDMKEWIQAQAERNGASINSEIIRSVRERMDRTASGEKPMISGGIPADGGGSATTVVTNEKGDEARGLGNLLRRPQAQSSEKD